MVSRRSVKALKLIIFTRINTIQHLQRKEYTTASLVSKLTKLGLKIYLTELAKPLFW